MGLRSQEDTDVDSFEETPEDNIYLEDVTGLPIYPVDSDKVEDYLYLINFDKLSKLPEKIFEKIL